MTVYSNLPSSLQGLFLTWDMFIMIMLVFSTICMLIQEKNKQHLAMNGGVFLLGVLLMADMLGAKENANRSGEFLPWMALVVVLTAMTIAAIYLIIKGDAWLRSNISSLSIKEATEKLPTGLCFYEEDGKTLLVNPRMHELSYQLFQRNIQNGKLFWEDLLNGRYAQEITALHEQEAPILRFPDERVWEFERHPVELSNGSVYRITAVDVTVSVHYKRIIEEDTERLTKVNQRLREYGNQVDDTVRAEENLAARMKIHNDTGKTLLAIKAYINDLPGMEAEELLHNWQANLALMSERAVNDAADSDQMTMLKQAAAFLGVDVVVEGMIPHAQWAETPIYAAARECLTNCVRHAKADELRICVHDMERAIIVTFTDNGTAPTREITEGGGLGNLRQLLEQSGCQMEVSGLPRFTVKVTVPKEEY